MLLNVTDPFSWGGTHFLYVRIIKHCIPKVSNTGRFYSQDADFSKHNDQETVPLYFPFFFFTLGVSFLMSFHLGGQLVLVRRLVDLELEPVAAAAPLGLALHQPHPLDGGVVLVADAAHHAEGVHGVHNVRVLLGAALQTLAALHEERVLEEKEKIVFERKLLNRWKAALRRTRVPRDE